MPKIHTILMPHNPAIISKIGRKYSEKLIATSEAIKKLRHNIYDANPEKIFIITPPSFETKNIVINQSQKYIVDFKDFGDLSMQFEVNGDLEYSTKLNYFLKKNNFDANLFSEKKLDYYSFVPLYYLNKLHISSKGFENEKEHDQNIKSEFSIISCSESDISYHLKFGEFFYDFLHETKNDIFIIICGDFAKKIRGADDYKKEEASKLSYKIIDLIKTKKYDDIFLMGKELEKANYPWVKPFACALPIIKKLRQKPNIVAMDKEFDEIYLTINFG